MSRARVNKAAQYLEEPPALHAGVASGIADWPPPLHLDFHSRNVARQKCLTAISRMHDGKITERVP
jgi:hypothetical protein